MGEPVFTTEDGFYKYDIRTNTFIPHDKLNTMFPGSNIHELHPDKKGNIWYFTLEDAGVFRLQEDGSYVKVEVPFRELKGKFIKWFQFVYPLGDEHVFFGTHDGFVHYTPEYPKNYQYPFRAFIRSVYFSGYDSVIYQGHSMDETILAGIPFKFNHLQFEFTANDFENPQSIQFSTYLEGFENDWTGWQKLSMREFTNLKKGNYKFHVKAKNIFGTESSSSTMLFEIFPPWYLKWWAYLIYFIVFIILSILTVKYIKYRMAKSLSLEEERQKQLFREREKQLQTEALEAEKEVIRLSNEQLSAEMRQKDKELANSTMQMIQKSKSLIAIKRELSQLSREIRDDLITSHIHALIRKINREIDTENQWEIFEKHFESVHEEFLQRLKSKHPHLTPREMKLCAYLRLNISSKEIATLMNISTRGVEISRYRLRKKLNLEHDTNLTDFIMSF
jgi:DNA-binding CsgD family transcriptional regulator